MTKRFDEDDLFDFLTGTAQAPLRDQIEAAEKTDATLRAELAVMRGLQALGEEDRSAAQPNDLAWHRLKTQIMREEAAPKAAAPQGWLRIAAVLLAAIVLGQGAYIASTFNPSTPALYDTATGPSDDFVLTVAFTQSAQASEITALMRTNGARVIDGPSALGLYRIAFDSADARADARAVLEEAPIIELLTED